jgi:TonB-linked SusC/RagA family outer membrane protein
MKFTALFVLRRGGTAKIFLLMNMLTLCLLSFCLTVSANGYAQKISLSEKDVRLEKVLKDIHKQSGYEILYNDEMLSQSSTVTLKLKNVDLKDALVSCLYNQPFDFVIMGKTVIIRPRLAVVAKPVSEDLPPPPPHVVKGSVTDEKGVSLGGVSILIKGTSAGVSTSNDGTFSLNLNPGETIIVSFVGYERQEIRIGDKTMINVVLIRANSNLDEVVVGYGTQKKIDLTGSIATINAKELENRPVTNVSSSLAGLAAGVYVHQGSGQPGSDGATIQIRGQGTLSSTSTLVLVDGIIGSMDAVNPVDVESITILKDAASASIYGALAANGVILITTKKGSRSNRPIVTYNAIFSQTNPTGVPQMVSNTATYLQLMNQGYTNIGNTPVFDSATVIQPFINAEKDPNGLTSLGVPNYVAYPNTNWAKVMIQQHTLQNHNVSISGGNEKTTYNLSLGYLNDPGLIAHSGIEKYQFRVNVESKIGDNITVGTQTFAYLQNAGLADVGDIFGYLVQASPAVYPYYKGMYGSTSAVGDVIGQAGDLVYLTTSNQGTNTNTFINTTWYGKVKLIKGLTFEPKVNYQTNFSEQNYDNNPVGTARWNFITMTQVTPQTPPSQLNTYNNFSKTWNYTLESVLRYNTTIAGSHNIGAIAGFNQYYYDTYSTSITGLGLIDPSVPAISSATSITSATGSATNYSLRSFFGRVNYNYKDKYLLEGNLRDDASSRFGPNYAHGYFPSVSAGWNLAKESFMAGLQDHNIQNIKLRGSWGQLGNNASGNYSWQATYGSANYPFNGTTSAGLAQSSIANPNLHWETTNVTDIGLDALALRKLTVTLDWYRRFTHGILYQPPQDPTVGTASAPVLNLAQVVNSGVEIDLSWRDHIGKVDFSVGGNLSYNYLNRVAKYKGPLVTSLVTDSATGEKTYNSNIGAVSTGGNTPILEGHQISEYYLQTIYKGTGTYFKNGVVDPNGGPRTGMIRTPQDLAWVQAMIAAGHQFPVNTVGPGQMYYGDLIYADNNGDGNYGTTNDQKFQKSSSTPKFVFGFNMNVAYKGIDLSTIWAGAAGMKYYWNASNDNSNIVRLGCAIPERVAANHYYYDVANPSDPRSNINGYFPRLKSSDNIDNIASTFWLYNASYLRLKNLQIGYTLPKSIMGHVGSYITRARFFVSGENLLTVTKYPGPDPENGTGVGYPSMKQYAFGATLTF